MMNDSKLFFQELEADTLARTIWGEARGEGSIGMQAVAAVIINRLAVSRYKGKFWWRNSIIDICQKPYQFSCWNRDDPNYRKLLSVDSRDITFAKALAIAQRSVQETLPDPTKAATHYHTAGIHPFWSRDQQPVAVIGHHIFYRILS